MKLCFHLLPEKLPEDLPEDGKMGIVYRKNKTN